MLSFYLQVAAVVFTEDLKRLYVTMKEGFPLEYIVRLYLSLWFYCEIFYKKEIHWVLCASNLFW